jgi:hypothetical protein
MNRIRSIPLKVALLAALFLVCATNMAGAQKSAHPSSHAAQEQDAGATQDQISGMYTFLREGEFVQITVESGKLTGFVSRYGDMESDRGVFLDQFFTKAALKGNALSFTTKSVHGTWFEFSGHIHRGDAPSKDKEGYWVITGTLKQFSSDESGGVAGKSREVVFKSFPDLDEGQ